MTHSFDFPGTLALTGAGEYTPPMQPVDEWLLGTLHEAPRVVCLPTAAGPDGSAVVRGWMERGVAHFQALGVDADAVDIIDRETASDPARANRVRAANFVYLSGGKPPHLFNSLKGTPTYDALMDVLNRGGVVAGCSAGAMIWGSRSTPFPGTNGFELVEGIILPHFDEMPPFMANMVKPLFVPGKTFYGIDGNTALVIQQDGMQVRGLGGVLRWDGRDKQRFTDGQRIS